MGFKESVRVCVEKGSTQHALSKLLTDQRGWIAKTAGWLRKRHRGLAITHEQDDVEQEIRILLVMLCKRFRWFCRQHKIETKSYRAWRRHVKVYPECDVCSPYGYVMQQLRGRLHSRATREWDYLNRRHSGFGSAIGFEGEEEDAPMLIPVGGPTQETEIGIRAFAQRCLKEAREVLSPVAESMVPDMLRGCTRAEAQARASRKWTGGLRKDAQAVQRFMNQQHAAYAAHGG